MLRLIHWLEPTDAEALQDGASSGTSPEQGELLARFCGNHGLPWASELASLTAVSGAVPAALRERNRGRVRAEIDVPWILQDLKVAAADGVEDELLALWALEQSGASVEQGLRRVHVLAGLPPSAREDALLSLLSRASAVNVVLFRGLTDDDVDRYVDEA